MQPGRVPAARTEGAHREGAPFALLRRSTTPRVSPCSHDTTPAHASPASEARPPSTGWPSWSASRPSRPRWCWRCRRWRRRSRARCRTWSRRSAAAPSPIATTPSAVDADVPDPSTCVVSERSGEAGVTVTVFSVKGGAKVTLITRRTADGKVYVTVQGGGEIGLEFGPPAGGEVSIDAGNAGDHRGRQRQGRRQGSSATAQLTWAFPNEDKAHEFAEIVANKARDAALDTNPITGIGRRIIGVGEDRDDPGAVDLRPRGRRADLRRRRGRRGPAVGQGRGRDRPLDRRALRRAHQADDRVLQGQRVGQGGRRAAQAGRRPRPGRGRGPARRDRRLARPAGQGDGHRLGHGQRPAHRQARRPVGQARRATASAPTCASTSTSPTRPTARRSTASSRSVLGGAPISSGASPTTRRSACASTTQARPTSASRASGRSRMSSLVWTSGVITRTADVHSAYYYDRETGSFVPWVECKR